MPRRLHRRGRVLEGRGDVCLQVLAVLEAHR